MIKSNMRKTFKNLFFNKLLQVNFDKVFVNKICFFYIPQQNLQ